MVKYLLQVQSGFHIMLCLSATLKITDPDKATVPITATLHICKSVTRAKMSPVQKCHLCKNVILRKMSPVQQTHPCKSIILTKMSPVQKLPKFIPLQK